jgi:hypothetical protein
MISLPDLRFFADDFPVFLHCKPDRGTLQRLKPVLSTSEVWVHIRQQMELSRFEISSEFVSNMGFPTFFDEDLGLRYSDKGTRSCARIVSLPRSATIK